jgi:hypothetical protein
MGKPSRDKGLRRERAIVDIHMKCGLRAERVRHISPASGRRASSLDLRV